MFGLFDSACICENKFAVIEHQQDPSLHVECRGCFALSLSSGVQPLQMNRKKPCADEV